MAKGETRIAGLCAEFGVIREALYRLVTPTGELAPDVEKLRAGARDPMFWICQDIAIGTIATSIAPS
jgi:hypothetical protein